MQDSNPLGNKLAAYAQQRRREVGGGFSPDDVTRERLRRAVRGRFGEGVGAPALTPRWEQGLWLRAGGALVGGIAVVTGAALLLGRGEGPVTEQPGGAGAEKVAVMAASPAATAKVAPVNSATTSRQTPSRQASASNSATHGVEASIQTPVSKARPNSTQSPAAQARAVPTAQAPADLRPDWRLTPGPSFSGDPAAREEVRRMDFFALLGIDAAEVKPVVAEVKPVVKKKEAQGVAPAKSSWLTLNVNLISFSLGSGKGGGDVKGRAGGSSEKAASLANGAGVAAAGVGADVPASKPRVVVPRVAVGGLVANPEPVPPRGVVSAGAAAPQAGPARAVSRVVPEAGRGRGGVEGAVAGGEQRYVREDSTRHLRRNFNSPPLPEVLQEFVIRKRSNGMAIVDADGSIYDVVPEETLVAPDSGVASRRVESAVCFKAAGMHKSSGQWVVFDGWLVPAEGEKGELASGGKGTGSQWAAVPGLPLGGMRVCGEVRLGERTRFPLAADPVAKQGS